MTTQAAPLALFDTQRYPVFVPRRAVAEYLSVSVPSLLRWEQVGKLPRARELSPTKHLYVRAELMPALERLTGGGAGAAEGGPDDAAEGGPDDAA